MCRPTLSGCSGAVLLSLLLLLLRAAPTAETYVAIKVTPQSHPSRVLLFYLFPIRVSRIKIPLRIRQTNKKKTSQNRMDFTEVRACGGVFFKGVFFLGCLRCFTSIKVTIEAEEDPVPSQFTTESQLKTLLLSTVTTVKQRVKRQNPETREHCGTCG